MLFPKSGKLGGIFSTAAVLIGAGLFLSPALSFAGPEETTPRIPLPIPLAAGTEHSLAVASDGTVWRWGLAMDKYGGPWTMILQPARVDGIDGVVATEDSIVRTPVQVVGQPPLIISYFNERGQPYINEEYGFWFNWTEEQWYRGTKSTRQIIPIDLPPWKEQRPTSDRNIGTGLSTTTEAAPFRVDNTTLTVGPAPP